MKTPDKNKSLSGGFSKNAQFTIEQKQKKAETTKGNNAAKETVEKKSEEGGSQ